MLCEQLISLETDSPVLLIMKRGVWKTLKVLETPVGGKNRGKFYILKILVVRVQCLLRILTLVPRQVKETQYEDHEDHVEHI